MVIPATKACSARCRLHAGTCAQKPLGLLDPLQPRAEDEVEHRQKDERQNGGEEQAENVHRGERMPERAAGVEEREQTADRRQER